MPMTAVNTMSEFTLSLHNPTKDFRVCARLNGIAAGVSVFSADWFKVCGNRSWVGQSDAETLFYGITAKFALLFGLPRQHIWRLLLGVYAPHNPQHA